MSILRERRRKKEEGRKSECWTNNILLPSSLFSLLSLNLYADELRDVRPPVGLPEFPWLWVILGVVLAGFPGVCLWLWLRHRRMSSKRAIIKTPWEVAYERLENLKERNLFGQGMAKEYFIELSDIQRAYIEDRFNIRAPDMTTEEFLEFVKNTPSLEARHKDILKNFLRLSDMVKFAKYGPSAQEALQSFELVKQFVNETKENLSDSEGRGAQGAL